MDERAFKLYEKCECMSVLTQKACNHWTLIKFIFQIPLILTSSVMCILNSFSDIFSGNWQAVLEQNFSNQLWKRFFSTKVIAGFVYGVYVSNKNMK